MLEYVEFGQQDTGVDVEQVELDRGFGLDGQVFTPEQDASCFYLNEDLDSDFAANALLYADSLGVGLTRGILRAIKTRSGVVSYITTQLWHAGMHDDAAFVHRAYYEAA